MTRSLLPARALLLLASIALGAAPARAVDAPEVPEVPEVPTVEIPESPVEIPRRARDMVLPEAPWRAVGFQDRAADCPAIDARHGACIEEVDFLDLSAMWGSGGEKDRVRRATAHDLADLWGRLLESMAYRWFREKDVLETTLQADGLLALPSPGAAWEIAHPDARRVVALPDRAAWLDAAAWTGATGLYAPVRYATPAGAPAPAPIAVLSGRFARRLGYDGRPYDFDVMDGDREASAPFFEQMYPFATAWTSGDPSLVPLAHFGFPRKLDADDPAAVQAGLAASLLPDDTWLSFETRAALEFDDFARLLGVQITRYALAEHTPNHLRVLAALTLMRSPPEALTQRAGRSRDLVAAALGQTDSSAEAESRLNRASMSIEGGFKLSYQQLPQGVVRLWLARLIDEVPLDEPWYSLIWRPRVAELLGPLARGDAPALGSARPDDIEAWLRVALQPGKDVDTFALEIERLGLALLVDRLGDARRDEVETEIFLDHVNSAISGGLDQRPGVVLTPDDLVSLTGEQWRGVVATHGRVTRPVSQGLGAVDPTAICTTLDGRAAQSEPSIRAARLDLLIAAKAGYTEASQLLWDTRDRQPLLSLDDPSASAPALDRLSDLPDGRSLYRVRWSVWTGWHLLWTSEGLPTGQRRLAVRSAAICSDLVLAAPDLAPTVVRAALLDGELRPTRPVTGREARAARGASATSPDLADRASWIQTLGRAPLRGLAAPDPGLVVAVFDVDQPARRRWFDEIRPHTPYLARQRASGDRQVVRTAAWAWYLRAAETEAPALIAPALRPDPNVATEVARPRWHHVPTTEFDLDVGLHAEPLRWTVASCNSDSEDTDVIEICDGDLTELWSYGFGAELSPMSTFWLRADHRIAAEAGLLLRLDITPPGHAWIYRLIDDEDPTDPLVNGPDYAWGFRPAAGFVVGLRRAPLPGGLYRIGGSAWPWGAERPDGSSHLARTTYGLRLSGLYATSYSGAELTGGAELWAARSLRDARGPHAPFTPYQPAFWLGPYLDGRMSFHPPLLSIPDEQDRYLELRRGWSVHAGIRGQFRLKAPLSSLPEAP